MPAAIDQAKRQAITADIQAGKPRNQIARDHSVSGSTVTSIAKNAGIDRAFDRSKTQKCARARVFDAAAARNTLIEDLYGDAQKLRQRAWSEYTQVVTGPQGAEFVTTKLPPLSEVRSAYTAFGIAVDKASRLEDRNSGSAAAVAGSLLGSLFDQLQQEHGDGPGDGS